MGSGWDFRCHDFTLFIIIYLVTFLETSRSHPKRCHPNVYLMVPDYYMATSKWLAIIGYHIAAISSDWFCARTCQACHRVGYVSNPKAGMASTMWLGSVAVRNFLEDTLRRLTCSSKQLADVFRLQPCALSSKSNDKFHIAPPKS